MIHFVIYEYLKKELAIMQNKKKNDDKTTFDFVCFMLCGACSKTCATIVAYPHGKNSFRILRSNFCTEIFTRKVDFVVFFSRVKKFKYANQLF